MDFRNRTIFPSLAFKALDAHGEVFHVAVLRMTLDIAPSGALSIAPHQRPLAQTDIFYGDVGKSSVQEESDFAPYKPWCDVIVIGDAVSPTRQPLERFEAGIRMSRKGNTIVDKRVIVTGPRFWQKRFLRGWTLTKPEPIAALPLRYEYAYGGECRIDINDPAAQGVPEKYRLTAPERAQHPEGADHAPAAHACYEANPIGRGYSERWYLRAKKLKRFPAPQIEAPLHPLSEFGKAYAPQGLGIIGRAWTPRSELCGTIDNTFVQSKRPLPEDFDFAYWNGAQPDLQVSWPQGDETIDLVNIAIPESKSARSDSQGNQITRLVLPGHKVCALATLPDAKLSNRELRIDTLSINASTSTISLTYRLKLPQDQNIQSLEVRVLSAEEKEVLDQHCETVTTTIEEKRKLIEARYG